MGIKHTIHHGLELALAKRAIGEAMDAYSARFADYSPTFAWETDHIGRVAFHAKGVTVVGEIEIIGPNVTVDLEVPLILRLFRGKAMEVIDREVKAWCEKARNGELD